MQVNEISVQQVPAKKATRLISSLAEWGVAMRDSKPDCTDSHGDKLNVLMMYRNYWGKLDNKIFMHA